MLILLLELFVKDNFDHYLQMLPDQSLYNLGCR